MSMLHEIQRSRTVPTGIGLGLRARFLDRVAAGAADGGPAFVELSPENYMHRGGRNPARLEQVVEIGRVRGYPGAPTAEQIAYPHRRSPPVGPPSGVGPITGSDPTGGS